MHTILNCDLSNFEKNRSNVAIMRSIHIDEIFAIYRKTKFYIPCHGLLVVLVVRDHVSRKLLKLYL